MRSQVTSGPRAKRVTYQPINEKVEDNVKREFIMFLVWYVNRSAQSIRVVVFITSSSASNTENGIDGDDLDTEPGLEEGGGLAGGVGGRHFESGYI